MNPCVTGLKISLGKRAFLRCCVVFSVSSSLAGCGLDTHGVGHFPTQWLISVAKDSNSPGGTSKLKVINQSNVSVYNILLGDFDGDRKADVFTTWGGKWRFSSGGTSSWQIINKSSVGVSSIRLGDFDGDNKTDVFTAWGGKWRVSLGGTSSWQVINKSSFGVPDILLGDFDGDKKADVFTKWQGQWHVSVAKDSNSLGGTSNWKVINESTVALSETLLGDFDGDKKADVFTTGLVAWLLSVAKDSNSLGGTSKFKVINKSNVSVHDILLGDFGGNNRVDVFTTWGGKWRISPGGTSKWEVINESDVGVSEILLGDFDGDRKVDVFTTL
jgi:hypothetical protein